MGHISPFADRLARRGLVCIEKDHLGCHLSYTWIGPKEKAPGGKFAANSSSSLR
jgi:hypothetical protein